MDVCKTREMVYIVSALLIENIDMCRVRGRVVLWFVLHLFLVYFHFFRVQGTRKRRKKNED